MKRELRMQQEKLLFIDKDMLVRKEQFSEEKEELESKLAEQQSEIQQLRVALKLLEMNNQQLEEEKNKLQT